MPPVGFEPTISAGERPQTYALDRAATTQTLIIKKKKLLGPILSQFYSLFILITCVSKYLLKDILPYLSTPSHYTLHKGFHTKILLVSAFLAT